MGIIIILLFVWFVLLLGNSNFNTLSLLFKDILYHLIIKYIINIV